MKELFSAFGSEVFTPLVTLVSPGTIALSTWFVMLMLKFAKFRDIVDKNHVEGAVLLFLAALLVGLILEAVGALIETGIFDKRLPKEKGYESHDEDWYLYLRLAFKVEPVGNHYLKTLVLHLKFELDGALGLLVAAPGLLPIEFPFWPKVIGISATVALAMYMLWESQNSHRALSKVRHELLKGITVVGEANIEAPRTAPASPSDAGVHL